MGRVEARVSQGETIFGKIIRGEIPSDKVYEDDLAVAFRDIHPVAPSHVLVVPKHPFVSLLDSSPAEAAVLGHLLWVAAEVARREGYAEDGFRVVINNGESAGQEVEHLHLHVLGGRRFGWPPG
ncbi:MAG: histidine triad nucleotide-binding protein [Armatimonadetes bacterium]|nr:histidine triad nucleotide-binding protein [Armatimonadota bacterium]